MFQKIPEKGEINENQAPKFILIFFKVYKLIGRSEKWKIVSREWRLLKNLIEIRHKVSRRKE